MLNFLKRHYPSALVAAAAWLILQLGLILYTDHQKLAAIWQVEIQRAQAIQQQSAGPK
jgi:hypothetical protein